MAKVSSDSKTKFPGYGQGISKLGRIYAIDERHEPPSEEMCEFLIRSIPKISEKERVCLKDMEKLLLNLSGDATAFKRVIKSLRFGGFGKVLSWLYQSGILDYENQWNVKSGYELVMWRTADADEIERLLKSRPSYLNGKTINNNPTVLASQEISQEINKSTKKCCENPRPVISKRTGKRKCKNCGRKLKKKKVKSNA